MAEKVDYMRQTKVVVDKNKQDMDDNRRFGMDFEEEQSKDDQLDDVKQGVLGSDTAKVTSSATYSAKNSQINLIKKFQK